MKPSDLRQYISKMKSSISEIARSLRNSMPFISLRSGMRFTLIALIAAFFFASFFVQSKHFFSTGSSAYAFAETIGTFQSNDCTTPKSEWNLGQTACAGVTGALDERRIVWIAPDGNVADVSAPFTGTGTDTYTFQTTGTFAQYGTWKVVSLNNSGAGFAVATFLVRPNTPSVDLSILKFGPNEAFAGGSITYTIYVTNGGPDIAQTVVLSEPVPNNSTFASEAQNSGPAATCINPSAGGTGTSTCTIPSLNLNETAIFTFVYNVSSGTPADTLISNTATVSSSTNELNQADNTARYQVAVSGAPAPSPCIITCPADITVNNDPNAANPCTKVVTYSAATISGNCADSDTGQTPSVVCSPPSNSAFPVGTTTVVCGVGGTLCSFTVKVVDTRSTPLPAIDCSSSDITVNEGSPGAGSTTVTYLNPPSTGNCVQVTCNPPSGSSFTVGTTTVTCTATDFAEPPHTASCTFNVTVNTIAACTLTCPNPITKNNDPGECGAVATYTTPPAGQGCGTVSCDPPSNSFFPVGSTTVICTATDSGGGVLTTCSFTVTVNDTGTLTCPANLTTTENPPGSGSATVNYQEPAACPGVTVTCNPSSGSSFSIGTTTVTCTASAGTGCSFTVTVSSSSCTITCPANQTVNNDPNQCGAVVTFSVPPPSGNCGSDPPNCEPPSGSFFPVGATTVICTSARNGTQCSFTVTVNDTSAPVITTCPAGTSASADSDCQAPVPNVAGGVAGTDNCTPANSLTITQSPAAGTLVGKGMTTITITVKDAANNSATCTTTITVNDTTAPTAVCKNITVFLDASGNASITAADVDNGSSDNCGITSRTVSLSTFTCANKGPNTVTLTVKDAANNTATCQATVTVVDITPPAIICPANIAKNNDPGQCSAVVTYANAIATDNCPGVGTPGCTPVSGSTFQKGTTTVTCTVSDASGNLSSCAFTVTVNDTEPPTIACLSDIVADFDPAVNGAVVTYATPVGTDNCPGAVTTQIAGLASGATFPAGTTTNTFKVTDASGLTAQCSFKVTVAITSIIGLDSVSITGSGIVDSYNSSGGYPATKGSLANVLSNGTITMGNSGKVFGNVRSTRAGVAMSGASQVTGNATAGTTVTRSGSATVGGTITNNALVPVMTMPSVPACGPPYSPATGITGTYSYNPSTGDLSLSGVNIATLANGTYCFHNVTLTNSAQLKVNGLVVIKLTGTLNASGATSFTNTTGVPGNLRILSSYTGTTGVTFGNSTNVHLVIYAPNTGVSISGAAPLFGTVVGKTLTIGNSGMIHYDIQLKSIWPDIWSLIQ